jgi:deoxycytidylate deaminase
VIHAGYERLLAQYAGTHRILILGASFAEHHRVVAKEIRALEPSRAAAYVRAAYPEASVEVVEHGELTGPLVAADDTLLRDVVAEAGIEDVTWVPVFLRWDRAWSRVGVPPEYDGTVTLDEVHRAFTRRAIDLTERSSDWWRQVGAVAVVDGRVLVEGHNRHLPSEHSPYADGDPRNEHRRGVATELTTALHAEAGIVARAARDGVPLAGADLYVSTFPCPTCARIVAEAGFARCFVAGGYSVLAGYEVLAAAGVEVVAVAL